MIKLTDKARNVKLMDRASEVQFRDQAKAARFDFSGQEYDPFLRDNTAITLQDNAGEDLTDNR